MFFLHICFRCLPSTFAFNSFISPPRSWIGFYSILFLQSASNRLISTNLYYVLCYINHYRDFFSTSTWRRGIQKALPLSTTAKKLTTATQYILNSRKVGWSSFGLVNELYIKIGRVIIYFFRPSTFGSGSTFRHPLEDGCIMKRLYKYGEYFVHVGVGLILQVTTTSGNLCYVKLLISSWVKASFSQFTTPQLTKGAGSLKRGRIQLKNGLDPLMSGSLWDISQI